MGRQSETEFNRLMQDIPSEYSVVLTPEIKALEKRFRRGGMLSKEEMSQLMEAKQNQGRQAVLFLREHGQTEAADKLEQGLNKAKQQP